jgi:hypothetical protein
MTTRHFCFRRFQSSDDLYKPFLFIFGRCGMIFKISGAFLGQVERWGTLEQGAPLLTKPSGSIRKKFAKAVLMFYAFDR